MVLILPMLLANCVSSGAGVGRILDRPPDFAQGVIYSPVQSGQGKVWCLTDADYITETKHTVRLNHLIDKYECQIEILNGGKCKE